MCRFAALTISAIAICLLASSPAMAEEYIPERYLDLTGFRVDARPMDISKIKLECLRLAKKNGVDPKAILGKYQWGCTVTDKSGKCHIRYHDRPFWDNGQFITVWSTLRHEQAHCAGWPADHSN